MSRSSRRKTLGDETSVLTVHVPITFRRRGGRKTVVSPDGATPTRRPIHPNSALARAITRAWRWQKMLEGGRYTSIAELANAEGANASYVSRLLRLNLLAPDILESILDRRANTHVALAELMQGVPTCWIQQRSGF